MKRFVAVLAGLLTLPAFGEIAPLYFEEFSDVESQAIEPVVEDDAVAEKTAPVVVAPVQNSRANPRGRVTSRAASANARTNATRASRNGVVARTAAPAVTNRAATSRSATARTVATRGVNARSVSAKNQIATTRRAMQNGGANVARASITTTDTVNTPLYSGNVVSRAGVRSSGGAVRARIPTISASVSNSGTSSVSSSSSATTAASTTSAMDELAQVTAFCKAQYTECMDNFCNVLDDGQGRCSCSKNIKNYEKTENALKEANEALQDVAQQIQYIGLSSSEIETLFAQTEAEATLSGQSDNSALKNALEKIQKDLLPVKSGTASSSDIASDFSFGTNGLIEGLNIDANSANITGVFGTATTKANTNSISNQRGEQLYKTAAARCKAAILTDCQAQGVDVAIVANSYDMEIDKQCVAYERSLTDANDEMARTVRNAKAVLQRARLMVAQQKNSYDLRGCVNALDSCMQDDFVCGNEYENCLDPSGKYIVDGEIVVGSAPGQAVEDGLTAPQYSTDGLYSTWNYKNGNAWNSSADNSLAAYVDATVVSEPIKQTSTNMSEYLQFKIGYYDKENNKNNGMCMSVLNKCQAHTYDKDGKYMPNNPVVKEYLNRTLIQIKSKQDAILADYAESCIADISSCLGENNYDETNPTSTKSKIAINACRSQIVTCMSVTGNRTANPTPSIMADWVKSVMTDSEMGISSVCNASGDNNCKVVTHITNNSDYSATGTNCGGLERYNPTLEDGKCKPSQASCEQIHATWENGACVCYGYWGYQNSIQNSNPTLKDGVKYTGYMCFQQND